MLLFAFLPFAVMWSIPTSRVFGDVGAVLDMFLFALVVPGFIGAPAASLLYFVWRYKSEMARSASPNLQLDADAQARQSTGR